MAKPASATPSAPATRSPVPHDSGAVLPDDLVGYRLRRVHAGFVEAWRTFWTAEGLSLTPVQGGILMLIASRPGLTQTELAQWWVIDSHLPLRRRQQPEQQLERGALARARLAHEHGA